MIYRRLGLAHRPLVRKRVSIVDDKLYQFVCIKCKRELAWVLSASSVYCPDCRRWTGFQDIKNPKSEEIAKPELRDDEIHDQLVMF